ncbi:hypothetical protein UFOVP276_126 [uncultured Caudovirales phage]|uniref:Uncharacterized protein n=1 Tax=uncultured Caudovirales phage TaxID=2100421 RepID=A0A6J5LQ83_9CAUD|nr:hypothetical protein UFOVP127_20 [uncultured Caudovirales phage]CAB4135170.1 hypothetical protein UFOVP276_126 [uncultured Caudovirales phage]
MAIIKIRAYVPDVHIVLRTFNRIEVQKSIVGTPTFSDASAITDVSAVEASVTGTVLQPYSGLKDTTLKVRVNQGTEYSLLFSDNNPVSIQSVIDAINGEGGILGLVASDAEGYLKLDTVVKGTKAVIQITDGDANASLGFTTNQTVSGKDEHVQLMRGVSTYTYVDHSGSVTDYYRTRFINSLSGEVSEWSDWILGTFTPGVASDHLTIGTAKLSNIDGSALVCAKITLVNVYSPLTLDGYFFAGRSKTVVTDKAGVAQVTLVKGSVIDVILEGTSIVRRIQVPSTSAFDLLDPAIQIDDAFSIQYPDLPAAVRSTL